MNSFELVALKEDLGKRIDAFLAENGNISRSAAQKSVAAGEITVNSRKIAKSYKLCEGDIVCVNIPPVDAPEIKGQDIALDIVYEDDYLLVVNKAKGMVVHPGAGNRDNTLANALLFHCNGKLSDLGGESRQGIVHRIDKDTSGLLVAAKDNRTHAGLSEQFSAHSISRVYYAVVHGVPREESGTISGDIGRHQINRVKFAVVEENSPGSKKAVTHYKVIRSNGPFSLLELRLETGRTHQIRVHMANMGFPVAGDRVYGPKKSVKGINGQCLHAKTLGFIHPATNKYMEFNSDLPDYFIRFMKGLGLWNESENQ